MELEAILFIVFLFAAIVLGPLFAAENRLAFMRPDRKSDWFVR
jgi:hypothetical protein